MQVFPKKHFRIAGYTLVELMIVIFIIAAISAFAIPAILQWMPDMKIKGAARGIYSAMQEAKSIAIQEKSSAAVFFNNAVAPNTYQILRHPGQDGNWGTADDINADPGPDGVFASADDIPEDPPIPLPPTVTYSTTATTNAPNDVSAFTADFISYNTNMVVFNTQGYLFDLGAGAGVFNTGFVYISNANDSYAIGTPARTGRIRLLNWNTATGAWVR